MEKRKGLRKSRRKKVGLKGVKNRSHERERVKGGEEKSRSTRRT